MIDVHLRIKAIAVDNVMVALLDVQWAVHVARGQAANAVDQIRQRRAAADGAADPEGRLGARAGALTDTTDLGSTLRMKRVARAAEDHAGPKSGVGKRVSADRAGILRRGRARLRHGRRGGGRIGNSRGERAACIPQARSQASKSRATA